MKHGLLEGRDFMAAERLVKQTMSGIDRATRLSDASLRRSSGIEVNDFDFDYDCSGRYSTGTLLWLDSTEFAGGDVPYIAWGRQKFYIEAQHEEEIKVPGGEVFPYDKLTVNLVVEREHQRRQSIFDRPARTSAVSDFTFETLPDANDLTVTYNERELLYPELLLQLLQKDKMQTRELKYVLSARSLVALAANQAVIGSVKVFLESCCAEDTSVGELQELVAQQRNLDKLTREWSRYSRLSAPENITRPELMPLLEVGQIPGY